MAFKPAQNLRTLKDTLDLIGMQRDVGGVRQVVVASLGETEVLNGEPLRVRARACAITLTAPDWDARSYARRWTGIEPVVDEGGIALFSYQAADAGNVSRDIDDKASLLRALNAGELRTLAATERGAMRGLSWVVFEAPNPPAKIPPPNPGPTPAQPSQPPAPLTAHDADPFGPCIWKDDRKSAARRLFCPGRDGKVSDTPERVKVTETTVTEARGGDVKAMLRLTAFYVDGPEKARDPGAAFAWSLRAAEAGDAEGAFNVGLAFDNGLGMAPDKGQAAGWYQKAVAQDNTRAMINLAALYLAGRGVTKDPAAALALVRRAADAGMPAAVFDMGVLYQAGQGAPQNYSEALRWYRLGAERHDENAKYAIGVLYADGLGVPQSNAEAIRWFIDGQRTVLNIAMSFDEIYVLGLNLTDPRKRSQILGGDGREAQALGLHLAGKQSGDYRPNEAAPLLQWAADKGWPAAMMRLGEMYAEGEGVPRDETLALQWLREGGRRRGAYRRANQYSDPDAADLLAPAKGRP